MVTRTGFEPMNACVKGMCVQPLHQRAKNKMVGLGGLEPPTSRLSGVRSNQLSYKPILSTDYYILPYNNAFDKYFFHFLKKTLYKPTKWIINYNGGAGEI